MFHDIQLFSSVLKPLSSPQQTTHIHTRSLVSQDKTYFLPSQVRPKESLGELCTLLLNKISEICAPSVQIGDTPNKDIEHIFTV